jgi:hypothetical protein|tara:strand:+ start:991 stop:1191 length:201 start_codon:yes stop_codon:yes gene_type:complete
VCNDLPNDKGENMDRIEAINEAMQELDYEFWNAEGKRTEAECKKFTKQWQELSDLRDKAVKAVFAK